MRLPYRLLELLRDAGKPETVEALRLRDLLEERLVQRVGVRSVGAVRDLRDGGQPRLLGGVADLQVGAVDLSRVLHEERDVRAGFARCAHVLARVRAGGDQHIEVTQELPVADLLVARLEELGLLGEHRAGVREERFGGRVFR